MNKGKELKLCQEISKEFVKCYKKVSGRGPSNIFVKIIDNDIEIHVTLVPSPLEIYIYENFENSEEYLRDMYSRIFQIAKVKFINNLEKNIGLYCEDVLPVKSSCNEEDVIVIKNFKII